MNFFQHRLQQRKLARLVRERTPVRLHLGCGENRFPGYINIDFPPSRHSVQTSTAADVFADVRRLSFPAGSVREVRLHHVFEHFPRAMALRLLCEWHGWLEEGGKLVIETPDYLACARKVAEEPASAAAMLLTRHAFGSQEASWAIHYDGWWREKFERVLGELGYARLAFTFSEWHGLHNIQVEAEKDGPRRTPAEQEEAVRRILTDSRVDDTPSERKMVEIWMDQFRAGSGEL